MKQLKYTVVVCLLALAPSAMGAELGGLMDQAKSMGSDSLGSLLGGQLGISSDQAAGGLGGLFNLAKNQLSADNFETLAGAVPGVSGYLEKAQALGVLDQPITSAAGLTEALGGLGLDAATIEQFLPAAVEAIGAVGGDQARALVSSLLPG